MASKSKKIVTPSNYADPATGQYLDLAAQSEPSPDSARSAVVEQSPDSARNLTARVNDEMDHEYGWIQRGDLFSIMKAVLRELVTKRLSDG